MDVESPSCDGRRMRGDASRRAILTEAVDLATIRGLEGLSIGVLAEHVGASKSGVVALFGSKLDLQLAAIDAARDIYIANVIEPALRQARGIQRLWALCQIWLRYSRTRIFTGGCFFRATASEVNSRNGPLRDKLITIDQEWIAFVERCVLLAVDDLPQLEDSRVLAFELIALMDAANNGSLLHGTDQPYLLAEISMRRLLIAAGAAASELAQDLDLESMDTTSVHR